MRPIDRQLIKTCKNGDGRTIEKLLFRSANPNAQDDEWPNPTALLIATQNSHLKIIITLIQHGANPPHPQPRCPLLHRPLSLNPTRKNPTPPTITL